MATIAGLRRPNDRFGPWIGVALLGILFCFDLSEANAQPASDGAQLRGTGLLRLSSPEGYRWSANAFRMTIVGPDDKRRAISPADFPLRLPAGNYHVRDAEKPVQTFQIRDGGETQISPPVLGGPFVFWDEGDTLIRGPSLQLRGPGEMQLLRASLAPFPRLRSFEDFGAPRAGLSQGQRAAYLVMARTALQTAARSLPSISSATRPQQDRFWSQLRWALALVQALGTREDPAFLLSLRSGNGNFDDRLFQAATLLEARLGVWKTGAVRRALDEAITSDNAASMSLVSTLAEIGDQSALVRLAEFLQDGRHKTSYSIRVYYQVLAASTAPEIISFFRGRLQAYAAAAKTPREKASATVKTIPDYEIVPYALLALAAQSPLPDADRQLIENLPIQFQSLGPEFYPLVSNPVDLFSLLAGLGDKKQRHASLSYRSGLERSLCAALTVRRGDAESKTVDALAIALMQSERGPGAQDKKQIANWQLTTEHLVARCHVSPRLASYFAGLSPVNAEARLFSANTGITWAMRPPYLEQMARNFKSSGSGLLTQGTDLFDASRVAELLPVKGDGDNAISNYRALYLAKLTATSNAYTVLTDFPAGAEQRTILRRLEKDDQSVAIHAIIEAKPRLVDGKLLVGVRIRIGDADTNGLAAAISGRDQRLKRDFENSARAMISRARYSLDDGTEAMTFLGSSASGVHVFEASMPKADGIRTTVHLDMRLLDTKWTLDLPLYASQFAFGERLSMP